MDITPGGETLGATITGIDLALPLSDSDFMRNPSRPRRTRGAVFPAPDARPGSAFRLRPPLRRTGDQRRQRLPRAEPSRNDDPVQHEARWGSRLAATMPARVGTPTCRIAVTSLSPTSLHAQHVPSRNGKPLGETQFRNMHAAYEDLPDALKHKLEGRTATHDFCQVLGHDGGKARLHAEAADP